jgi:hypothetical protein
MATYTFTKEQMTTFFKKVEEEFSETNFTYEDLMNMKEMPKIKKAKKVKDPNAPKKALSTWIFFTNDTRPKLKEENPDKSMTELTTMMSLMWKDISEEDKAPFNKMAEEDKERYKKDMEGYNSQTESSDSENDPDKVVKKVKEAKDPNAPKKVKEAKDPNAPKKNLNSYMLFSKEIRSKHPNVKHTATVLKTMWKDLDDKGPYTEMALKDKERYLKEKKEYDDNQ